MRTRSVRFRHLAQALAVDDRPRYLIAALAGMPPNHLSMIVTGRQEPTLRQRDAIAQVLGVDSKHLFVEG